MAPRKRKPTKRKRAGRRSLERGAASLAKQANRHRQQAEQTSDPYLKDYWRREAERYLHQQAELLARTQPRAKRLRQKRRKGTKQEP